MGSGGDAVKVRCTNCDASGSVKAGLVPEGGCCIKCPVCKNSFFIEKEPSDSETAEGERGRRNPIHYPTYDPTYYPTDGGDAESEEDLFLYWWFFGF